MLSYLLQPGVPATCSLAEKPSQTGHLLPAGKPTTTTTISLVPTTTHPDDELPAHEATLLQRRNLARRRARYNTTSTTTSTTIPPPLGLRAAPEPAWTCLSCERHSVPRLRYVCAPCHDATAGRARYPAWMRRAANVDSDWVCCNCGAGESRWVHSCGYCKIHSRCASCVAAAAPARSAAGLG